MISAIIAGGFYINYFMFNSKIVTSESKNPFMNRSYPSSYLFNVTLYMSRFVDSDEPFEATTSNFQEAVDEPTPDLCNRKITFSTSRYYFQVGEKNTKFSCVRKQLTNGTDVYTLNLLIKNVEDDVPELAFVRFKIDSPANQIVHFFKWEYWSIWRFLETVPTAYTKLTGFVTPQMMTRSNKNITTAFKGPESTKIFYRLIPTHYGNEIENQNFEGYQVFVDQYERGSVVNKRTMSNAMLSTDEVNAGFDLELVSTVTDSLYHVHVQRVKSVMETTAYVFGFIAGLVIVAHIIKFFLSKEQYFKALDRE